MSDNRLLLEWARKATATVYLAAEEGPASDLSRGIGRLADALEAAERDWDSIRTVLNADLKTASERVLTLELEVIALKRERDEARALLVQIQAVLLSRPLMTTEARRLRADIDAVLASARTEGK